MGDTLSLGIELNNISMGVTEFEAWPHFVTTGSPSLSLGFLSGSGIIMLSSL